MISCRRYWMLLAQKINGKLNMKSENTPRRTLRREKNCTMETNARLFRIWDNKERVLRTKIITKEGSGIHFRRNYVQ